MNKFLLSIDRISAWTGKAVAWTVVILTALVCYEVAARYVFNAPTQWGFDLAYMLFGTGFMVAGAYTLSRNGHVRADLLYRTLRPRTQAAMDLTLYLVFFVPGVAALVYAGFDFARSSLEMREVSSVTSAGTPVYPFKMMIPVAGVLLLLQAVAEVARCVLCLRDGKWPGRLDDVDEEDIGQLKQIISGGNEKGATP
jgi:TRAP-type mannitol/chloroaromatic compound transport system permease small subunit